MLQNMLDYIRITLYILLIAVTVLLVQEWQKEHATLEATSTSAAIEAPVASPAHPVSPEAKVDTAAPKQSGELIHVKTDLLDVTLDTHGGDILGLKLLAYPETLNSPNPFLLLNNDPKSRYIAESGLLGLQGPDTKSSQATYTVSQSQFALEAGKDQLIVPLVWEKDGLKITKEFIFKRNSYQVDVRYQIDNQSSQPWQGSLYAQLLRTDDPPENHGGVVNLTTFFGAAVSTTDKPFQKVTFKEMREANVNKTTKNGWAAMMQHYFISAWIPDREVTSTYYSRVQPNGLYSIGLINAPITVAPGTTAQTSAKLYSGPTIAEYLDQAAPNLDLTIDYGLFWFFSVAIFWMMQKIYNVVGNWGWSIVIVTVFIKLAFYKLSAKSYRSMSGLKALQPRIELLKERFGDDKQKLTQATLELYRQEKVNPMSGCLPILIQIPVFIALYWVLVESVQLRQAPFILWIHDLSQPDPYYILTLLMGASMYLQQRLNPPPPDPMQAKIMSFMPLVFMVLFRNFPAGLMLYWFVNNTLSFLQQWYIMQKLNKETSKKKLAQA